jgi:hypothetical protein
MPYLSGSTPDLDFDVLPTNAASVVGNTKISNLANFARFGRFNVLNACPRLPCARIQKRAWFRIGEPKVTLLLMATGGVFMPHGSR